MINFLNPSIKKNFDIILYLIFFVFFYRIFFYTLDWIIAFKAALIDQADKIFWDFEVYYCAIQNLILDNDPYKSVYTCSPSHKDFYFAYPPLTLNFFKPFSYLNFINAKLAWGFLSISTFFYSFLCLKRILKTRFSLILYFLIIIFSLDKTVIYSFFTGNVSFILFNLLIIGFYQFINKREFLFYFIVVFISLFKIYFLIYLFFPILLREKNSFFYVSSSIFFIFSIYFFDWIYEKDYFLSYIYSFQTTLGGTEHGLSGIGILNLFQKTLDKFSYSDIRISLVAYLFFVGIILYSFFIFTKKLIFNKERIIFSSIVLFLLSILLPRLVIYETILIVPLILYLVENLEKFYTKKNANIIFLFFFGFFLLNGDSSLIFLFLILTFLIIFLPAWRNW